MNRLVEIRSQESYVGSVRRSILSAGFSGSRKPRNGSSVRSTKLPITSGSVTSARRSLREADVSQLRLAASETY